jgi:hypothetical protein
MSNTNSLTIALVNTNIARFLKEHNLEYTTTVKTPGYFARLLGTNLVESVEVYDETRTKLISVSLSAGNSTGLSGKRKEISVTLHDPRVLRDLGYVVNGAYATRKQEDLATELEVQLGFAAEGREYQDRKDNLTNILNRDDGAQSKRARILPS